MYILGGDNKGKAINIVGPLPDSLIEKYMTTKKSGFWLSGACPLRRKTTPKKGNAVESNVARQRHFIETKRRKKGSIHGVHPQSHRMAWPDCQVCSMNSWMKSRRWTVEVSKDTEISGCISYSSKSDAKSKSSSSIEPSYPSCVSKSSGPIISSSSSLETDISSS